MMRTRRRVELVPDLRYTYKQQGRGRFGKNTRYKRRSTTVYKPLVTLDRKWIRESTAVNGIFRLITDMPAESMFTLDLLKAYKYQPSIEKRDE